MAYVSVGIQAGIIDNRNIAGCVLDLLQKCPDIHEMFKTCTEELQNWRVQIEQTEQALDRMQTIVRICGDTKNDMGGRLLLGNTIVAQRNMQFHRLRRDIAAKKKYIEEHSLPDSNVRHEKEQRLNEMKTKRERLQLQLKKLKHDIDSTYEEMYETEEKLYAFKDLRETRREEENRQIGILKEEASDTAARKRDLLTRTEGNTPDMFQMHVCPAEFRRMETEIEVLKHQQVQVDTHIEMQLEERDFLRETADVITQRVYNLEKTVRKETGDHGWNSALTIEPNWFQDMSGPSIWYASQPLTAHQLQKMREKLNRKPTQVPSGSNGDENEATSGSSEVSDDMVIIDMVKDEGAAL